MGRGKLKMEFINKEKTRLTTFQKRKKGLIKKAQEFSILCDVDTCVIIYGQKIDGRPVEPEIWPNDPHKVRSIISSYHEKSKEERGKRATNLSAFFESRKKRIEEEIGRLKRQNAEAKYPSWDNRISEFSYNELRRLSSGLKNKIEDVKRLIEMKRNQCLVELGTSPLALMEVSHSLTQSCQNPPPIYFNKQQQHQPQPQQPTPISINPFYQQHMSLDSNPMMLNWTNTVASDGDFLPFVASSSGTHPHYNPTGPSSFGYYNQGPTLMDLGNYPQPYYYPTPQPVVQQPLAMPVSVLKPPLSFSSQLNSDEEEDDEEQEGDNEEEAEEEEDTIAVFKRKVQDDDEERLSSMV
ncbi:Transcription factor, MADS-box [Dillenia turbinata]|uniref:Transcription factor, MADS-box n=1 Tax=Dillenia turbinata TaxID=194707 RepID=A0AAN8Z763_9MAGN